MILQIERIYCMETRYRISYKSLEKGWIICINDNHETVKAHEIVIIMMILLGSCLKEMYCLSTKTHSKQVENIH